MNKKILQKVIDELNKENPKLDYIRGILETLIESLPDEAKDIRSEKFPPIIVKANENMSDADVMNAKAKAAIETIKKISGESTSNA